MMMMMMMYDAFSVGVIGRLKRATSRAQFRDGINEFVLKEPFVPACVIVPVIWTNIFGKAEGSGGIRRACVYAVCAFLRDLQLDGAKLN